MINTEKFIDDIELDRDKPKGTRRYVRTSLRRLSIHLGVDIEHLKNWYKRYDYPKVVERKRNARYFKTTREEIFRGEYAVILMNLKMKPRDVFSMDFESLERLAKLYRTTGISSEMILDQLELTNLVTTIVNFSDLDAEEFKNKVLSHKLIINRLIIRGRVR